jgi:hypothetical protein
MGARWSDINFYQERKEATSNLFKILNRKQVFRKNSSSIYSFPNPCSENYDPSLIHPIFATLNPHDSITIMALKVRNHIKHCIDYVMRLCLLQIHISSG